MSSSEVPGYYKVISVIGIAVFLLSAGLIIFNFAQVPGSKHVAVETIDSASCIQCHTDEAVIAASTFGQGVVAAEASGG